MPYLIAIIILALAIPIGFFLKWITKEEIESGKKYFKVLFISSFLLSLFVLLIPIEYNLKISSFFALLFMAIVSVMSWWK